MFRAIGFIALPATVLGGAIGLAVRVERWEAVAVPRAGGNDPGAGRFGLGVNWAF